MPSVTKGVTRQRTRTYPMANERRGYSVGLRVSENSREGRKTIYTEGIFIVPLLTGILTNKKY